MLLRLHSKLKQEIKFRIILEQKTIFNSILSFDLEGNNNPLSFLKDMLLSILAVILWDIFVFKTGQVWYKENVT